VYSTNPNLIVLSLAWHCYLQTSDEQLLDNSFLYPPGAEAYEIEEASGEADGG